MRICWRDFELVINYSAIQFSSTYSATVYDVLVTVTNFYVYAFLFSNFWFLAKKTSSQFKDVTRSDKNATKSWILLNRSPSSSNGHLPRTVWLHASETNFRLISSRPTILAHLVTSGVTVSMKSLTDAVIQEMYENEQFETTTWFHFLRASD